MSKPNHQHSHRTNQTTTQFGSISQYPTTMTMKSVSFNDDASQTVLVERLYSMEEEKHDLWYAPTHVKLFRKQAAEKDAEECVRKACWKSLVQGILSQQAEQRRMGVNDNKGLRLLSRACSKKACQRAYREALAVAEEVANENPVHKFSVSTTYNENVSVHRIRQKTTRRSFVAVSA